VVSPHQRARRLPGSVCGRSGVRCRFRVRASTVVSCVSEASTRCAHGGTASCGARPCARAWHSARPCTLQCIIHDASRHVQQALSVIAAGDCSRPSAATRGITSLLQRPSSCPQPITCTLPALLDVPGPVVRGCPARSSMPGFRTRPGGLCHPCRAPCKIETRRCCAPLWGRWSASGSASPRRSAPTVSPTPPVPIGVHAARWHRLAQRRATQRTARPPPTARGVGGTWEGISHGERHCRAG
jgi:hypothetical protein